MDLQLAGKGISILDDGTLHPNYAGMDLITKCFMDALVDQYL